MTNKLLSRIPRDTSASKDAPLAEMTKISLPNALKVQLLGFFCDKKVMTIGGLEDQHKHPFCTYVTKRENGREILRRFGIGQYNLIKVQDGNKNKIRFWGSVRDGESHFSNVIINIDLDTLAVEYKVEMKGHTEELSDGRPVSESFDLNKPGLIYYENATAAIRDMVRDMQNILDVLIKAQPKLKDSSEAMAAQMLIDTLKEQSALKYGISEQ